MSSFGRNQQTNNNGNNFQRPAGKEDVPNKVKFSSVKLGQTKQGSATVGLYLKKDQAQKLLSLLTELETAGEDGCKIGVIVIQGKDYDSGYAYINPKEARAGQEQGNGGFQNQNRQGQGQAAGGYYKRNQGGGTNKSTAREFLQAKRLNDDNEEGQGN